MRPFIHKIVSEFYQKAVYDILIGYHFRKFEDQVILAHHLERITSFWEMQLMQSISIPLEKPFTLMYTHFQLGLKNIGELNRWLLLFRETLENNRKKTTNPDELEIIEYWKLKLNFFEQRFSTMPGLFGNLKN